MNSFWRVTILSFSLILTFLLPLGPLGSYASDDSADADTLYSGGNFEQALPLYEKLAEGTCEKSEHLKRLRYLGDCYCKCGQADKAAEVFKKIREDLDPSDLDERILCQEALIACSLMNNDFDSAEKLLADALNLINKQSPPNKMRLAECQACEAYISYLRSKWDAAAAGFEKALDTVDAKNICEKDKMIFAEKLYFATGGAYYHLNKFDKAKEYFSKMNVLDSKLFGSRDLQTGWSNLAISDVCHRLGQLNESNEYYIKAIRIFRRFNRDRIVSEYADKLPAGKTRADLESVVSKCVFGRTSPVEDVEEAKPLLQSHMEALATHRPCSAFVRPFDDAPGRVWLNPWVQQKGIVIGVHGLSLQHSSYDALARKLADAGYMMVAFDVRGFGTYRQAMGAEQLDFDSCMKDLQLVVGAIARDGGLPVFMLGESMGGAIAVQFTAQNPKLISGLIASVPAGKRYKQAKTSLKVALKFLKNKNKPFNIGSDVINQATQDPELRQEWAADPLTRTDLSPAELVRFQNMINKNLQYAKKLQGTPVIVFQGVGDKLVKAKATYDLFQSIASSDKSLVLVGNAEHLIFEEGRFTPTVLTGLISWMDTHQKSDERSTN